MGKLGESSSTSESAPKAIAPSARLLLNVVDFEEMPAFAQIDCMGKREFVELSDLSQQRWKSLADESVSDDSPMAALRAYAAKRFGADLRFSDEPGEERSMHPRAIVVVEVASPPRDWVGGDYAFKRQVSALIVNAMTDVGFRCGDPSPHEPKPLTAREAPASAALAALASLAEPEAKIREAQSAAVSKLFQIPWKGEGEHERARRNKELSSALGAKGVDASLIDYACRGDEAPVGQWVADLVALSLMRQWRWEENLYSRESKLRLKSCAAEDLLSEPAARAVSSLPPFEKIPVFDGLEPYPEVRYGKGNEEFAKPDLKGLDVVDALLLPESIGDSSSEAHASVRAAMVLSIMKKAPLAPGRAARLINRVMSGSDNGAGKWGSVDHWRPIPNKMLAEVLIALASADPAFRFEDVPLEGSCGRSQKVGEVFEKVDPNLIAALKARSERVQLEAAASEGALKATRPRL